MRDKIGNIFLTGFRRSVRVSTRLAVILSSACLPLKHVECFHNLFSIYGGLMTQRVIVGSLGLLAMVLGGIPGAKGQTSSTGQIVGEVTDPTGAVIPGANVTV